VRETRGPWARGFAGREAIQAERAELDSTSTVAPYDREPPAPFVTIVTASAVVLAYRMDMYSISRPDAKDVLSNWRPVTLRVRGRQTLSTGTKELREHLPAALRIVAEGEHRIVVHRHSQLVAALVPIPDYWFVTQIDDALRRHNWVPSGSGGRINPELLIDEIFRLHPPPCQSSSIPRPTPPPAKLADIVEHYDFVEPALLREGQRVRQTWLRRQDDPEPWPWLHDPEATAMYIDDDEYDPEDQGLLDSEQGEQDADGCSADRCSADG